jgi:serine/threonine protein kinase
MIYLLNVDLKPENILVTFDHKTGKCVDLKLCDFGLSTKFKPKTLLHDFCGSPGKGLNPLVLSLWCFIPHSLTPAFALGPGFFAPEMIINGAYYGDKVDVWSTGCILLELVAGHEKFCDLWMTAYDYEVLQDKEKFTETIHDTVEQLPELLHFSAELNDFILKFLELSQSKRPTTAHLCVHPWVRSLVETELSQRAVKLDSVSTKSMRQEFADSPSQSMRNMMSPTPTQLDDNDVDTAEERHAFIEMVFANLSDRERKHMQEYIMHHKDDGPDKHHAQMHLPPIVPSTPSIGNAKKILRKGNELANANYSQHSHAEFSPQAKFSPHDSGAVSPFSPQANRQNSGGPSRSNSISPLPGVSEHEEFSNGASEKASPYQTPMSKPISILKGSANGTGRQVAEPKQLLFASQSERDLQDNGPLSLSSSSY